VLSAAVLWWNATVLPFSQHWWHPPFFHPARDVAAFTENFVGTGLVASPVYGLTGNPIATYNVVFFLTFPLSAFGAYLLVWALTRRHDAAFVAGLAYGFSPYRTAEISHLQSLSSYWLPVILLGLHRFLDERRLRWLVLFGAAWLFQALTNGYYMLFGAVLIALWLAYFCSTRASWRTAWPIIVAWGVSSLPLVPIMWRYREVHERFGLRRGLHEVLAFSAPASAWFETPHLVRFWHPVLGESDDNLFPGLTAVLLVVPALFMSAARAREESPHVPLRHHLLRTGLAILSGLSLAAILIALILGSWSVTVGGLTLFRMGNLDRALLLLLAAGIPLILLTPRTRMALSRRSVLVFYTAATLAMAVLCCGPLLRAGNDVLLEPAPYRLLMYLPGFDQLRVPTRFWMLGVLCLATAAGVGFSKLAAGRKPVRILLFSVTICGLLLDGWLREIPLAVPPEIWSEAEASDRALPILELPLGPVSDAAATFRSIAHRRRVFNGVSGYDPPHYGPLRAGLDARDPAMLAALASLGPFDVVINRSEDANGEWTRYVSGAPDVVRIAGDRTRAVFRVPAGPSLEPQLGDLLPVAEVTAFLRDGRNATDGRIDTEWGDHPQRPGQWVMADLGAVREVGGVTHALGEYAADFPRQLAIDLSLDGEGWATVWAGPTAALAFLAAVRQPRAAQMRIAFAPHPARFVRLRQVAEHQNMWRVAELRVHARRARQPL
jgi:hypothetical protein